MHIILQIVLCLHITPICFTSANVAFPYNLFVEKFNIDTAMSPMKKILCKESSPSCHCRDNCTETGQCCTDYLWNGNITEKRLNENLDEILSNHTKTLLASVSIKQRCKSFFRGRYQIRDNFIMKDACFPTASVEELRKCTNPRPDLSLPVLGSDKNLYANVNCAKCNNIKTFKFLEMEVSCVEKPETTRNLTSTINSGECVLEALPKDKPYVKDCVSSTHCTDDKATFCKMFLNGDNAFCFSCGMVFQGPGPGDFSFSWSKTINFLSFDNAQNECPNGQVKDVFGHCIQRSELCGEGYELFDGVCVRRSLMRSSFRPIKVVKNSSLRNCITATPLKLLVYLTKTESLVAKIPKPIQKIQGKFNLSNSNWMRINIDNATDLWEANGILLSTEDHNTLKEIKDNSTVIKEISLFSVRETINTSLYGYDHTRTFKYSKLCASVIKIPVNNVTFLNSSCQSLLLLNQSLVNMSVINLEVKLASETFEESVYYCNKHHLHSSCLRQNIDPQNYVITNNHSLYFNMTGKQYTFGVHQYFPTLNGFQICQRETKQSMFKKYEWYTDAKKSQYYISVIGTSFSLIAYFIMFLAFYLLKDLKNTGGIHVFILVILLFFSDLIFIISSTAENQGYFCKWIGIILHFLLILVSQWTAVVAINLAVQFRGSSRNHHSPKVIYKKMFYCLIANTLIFALITSLNETGTIQFNYQVSCWIGSIYPATGFYFIPVTIVYITCIVSLSIVIHSIKKQQKGSEKVLRGNTNRTKVNISKIAIKLFVILGVTEFIGLIQIPTSEPSESELIFNTNFAIIYDITRSFRGVLICIVYLLNEKTLKMMKTYYKRRSTDHSMTTISSRMTVDSTV